MLHHCTKYLLLYFNSLKIENPFMCNLPIKDAGATLLSPNLFL